MFAVIARWSAAARLDETQRFRPDFLVGPLGMLEPELVTLYPHRKFEKLSCQSELLQDFFSIEWFHATSISGAERKSLRLLIH
ncbi:MAG TPA: hypothetical protein VFY29_16700 [Terriglobia bacterium]|nr:hypothetical protein [Terriglobia bacterium]